MRWKLNKLKNEVGTMRTVERFLFFPKTLGDETRWLEKAKIVQIVAKVDVRKGDGYLRYNYKYVDSCWKKEIGAKV